MGYTVVRRAQVEMKPERVYAPGRRRRVGDARFHRPARRRHAHQGKPVQVDPIKPTLKAPGTKRLKLEYDEPLSNFAFKFNLRRYSPVHRPMRRTI